MKFECTRAEYELIGKIVRRAMPMVKRYQIPTDQQSMVMDLDATHSNGCPLDFAKLLAFPDFDFAHDVFGIHRHLDRKTGILGGCFLPRCALPVAASV